MAADPWIDIPGTVESFDEAVGLGQIRADDGRRFPFHCIAIDDGTRTIAVGTPVRFDLHPALGRYEAAAIRTA